VRLYLLRHAPALSREQWEAADTLRPLSSDGEDLARAVAARIADLHLGIGTILTSPYERALRTASIVHQHLGEGARIIEDERLAPSQFTPATLAEMLDAHRGVSALMLVGHEPSMTGVLADLIGGGRFSLKKGGIARVDLDPASPRYGVLKLFVPPGLLK